MYEGGAVSCWAACGLHAVNVGLHVDPFRSSDQGPSAQSSCIHNVSTLCYCVGAFFLYCCSLAQTPSAVHYSVFFSPLLLSLGTIVLETIDTSQAAPHKEY